MHDWEVMHVGKGSRAGMRRLPPPCVITGQFGLLWVIWGMVGAVWGGDHCTMRARCAR